MAEQREVPRSVTAPPVPVPPAVGLFSLARKPAFENDRWVGGYEYRPDHRPRTVHNRSARGDSTQTGENLGSGLSQPEVIRTTPWLLEVVEDESTFTLNAENVPQRARRSLEANTSRLLERELWTGEIKALDDLPNRVLADPSTEDITGGSPLAPQAAVARLVQAVYDSGVTDCMVHAPMAAALRLPDGWRNEQTYEDYGFVVVPGAGYPGTGPDGSPAAAGTTWLYATAIVDVRVTDIEVMPEQIAESIHTASNTVYYRAQRYGAADFAGPAFACRVQL